MVWDLKTHRCEDLQVFRHVPIAGGTPAQLLGHTVEDVVPSLMGAFHEGLTRARCGRRVELRYRLPFDGRFVRSRSHLWIDSKRGIIVTDVMRLVPFVLMILRSMVTA